MSPADYKNLIDTSLLHPPRSGSFFRVPRIVAGNITPAVAQVRTQ